jgi:catalase
MRGVQPGSGTRRRLPAGSFAAITGRPTTNKETRHEQGEETHYQCGLPRGRQPECADLWSALTVAGERSAAEAERDVYETIENGDCPKWTLKVQVMPETDAAKVPYHPFDLTKIWPHKDYPLIEVEVMELNRNPGNFFAEVEQSAFNPANVVPGIGFHGSTLGYEPNDQGEWAEQRDFREPPLALEGTAAHWNHREDTDYFSQPGALFRLMSPPQRQALLENTARSIGSAPREIQLRHVRHCLQADPAYGEGVAKALGIPVAEAR